MRRLRLVLATSLLVATTVGLGCRGEVERIFYDDLDASLPDATTNGEDANVAPVPDASADGSVDAASDSSSDAGSDAACTATNTTDHCGACGNACDLDSGAVACGSSTCIYTCKAGRQNCNTTAPDLNGCECAGTGCCDGGACQTTHANGTGQAYYDCNDAGTYTVNQAKAACAALTGDISICAAYFCNGGNDNTGLAVCATTGGMCRCWKYFQGSMSSVNGRVSTNATCACPSGTDPVWN